MTTEQNKEKPDWTDRFLDRHWFASMAVWGGFILAAILLAAIMGPRVADLHIGQAKILKDSANWKLYEVYTAQ